MTKQMGLLSGVTVFGVVGFAGGTEPARAVSAVIRCVESNSSHKLYRLFVRGKATSISIETAPDTPAPDLTADRTPKGLIFGTLSHVESGAYIVTQSIAFIATASQVLEQDHAQVGGRRGNRILLVPVQPGPWVEKDSAHLYEDGQLKDAGFATAAFLKGDGAVAGWYYSNADKTPFEGLLTEAPKPVYQQYFEFRNGRRVLKGRLPATGS